MDLLLLVMAWIIGVFVAVGLGVGFWFVVGYFVAKLVSEKPLAGRKYPFK